MTPEQSDDQRRAFEVWVRGTYFKDRDCGHVNWEDADQPWCEIDDDRQNMDLGNEWEAWQAALAGRCPHRYAPLHGGCRCVACGHQIAWDATLVPEADERVAEETGRCAAVVQGEAIEQEQAGNVLVGGTLRALASKIRRTGKEHEAARLVREAYRAQKGAKRD